MKASKLLLIAFVMMLLLSLGTSITTADSPSNINWYFQYYNNIHLVGAPTATGHEVGLNHTWGTGAPATGINADNFSARWTGSRNFEAGTYEVTVTSDDGVRLWVDGVLMVDEWRTQAATTFKKQFHLTAGVHHLQVAYFEAQGDATLQLDLQLISADTTANTTWTAEYYTNNALSGSPAKILSEPDINYDWGTGAPASGIPADNFSVRWTTNADFTGGTYEFSATTDDGVRVWIDGALVIDQWHEQSVATHTVQQTLSAGSHRVQMAYFEAGGFAVAKLDWQQVSASSSSPTLTPGSEIVVDNLDAGFAWGGLWKYRHTAPGGQNHSHFWTYNTTFSPENYGKWTPTLPQSGNYEVWAYIPAMSNASRNVRYRVMHNGLRADTRVDQLAHGDTWVSLGTHYFNAANTGKEFVLVYDNTREVYVSRIIGFDAIKFIPR